MATATKTRPAKGKKDAPPTLESFISKLEQTFLFCRTERHLWHWDHDGEITVNSRGECVQFTRYKTCERCGSTHWTTYSVPDFRRLRQHTNYSDGYLAVKGMGRIPRVDVFIEQLKRSGLKVPSR